MSQQSNNVHDFMNRDRQERAIPIKVASSIFKFIKSVPVSMITGVAKINDKIFD
jgi:hypothetical protein